MILMTKGTYLGSREPVLSMVLRLRLSKNKDTIYIDVYRDHVYI